MQIGHSWDDWCQMEVKHLEYGYGRAVQCGAGPYFITSCAVLCSAVQCCGVLCSAAQRYAVAAMQSLSLCSRCAYSAVLSLPQRALGEIGK